MLNFKLSDISVFGTKSQITALKVSNDFAGLDRG
jgi:hypothetical protein